MEQQDWLIRQIGQLGIVLAGLLTRLFKFKFNIEAFNATEICRETLKSQMDFDLAEFIELQSDSAIPYLLNRKFNNNTLNQFADILLFIADELNSQEPIDPKCKIFYEKSLIILEYVNNNDSIFSLDRYYKIERIKNVL